MRFILCNRKCLYTAWSLRPIVFHIALSAVIVSFMSTEQWKLLSCSKQTIKLPEKGSEWNFSPFLFWLSFKSCKVTSHSRYGVWTCRPLKQLRHPKWIESHTIKKTIKGCSFNSTWTNGCPQVTDQIIKMYLSMQGYSKPEKHKTKTLTHTTSTPQECGLAKKQLLAYWPKYWAF